MKPTPIIERDAVWKLDIEGSDTQQDVSVPYAVTSQHTDMLLMTGWSETNVASIANRLHEREIGGLAVCSIIYPEDVDLTPDVLSQSVLKGTIAVIHDMNRNSGRPLNSKIIGIGHSRGGGEQIMAAHEYPELWSLLIESAPFGVTNHSLGIGYRQQRKEFIKRLKNVDFLQNKSDNQALPQDEIKDSDRLLREFMAGLEYGLEQDGAAKVNSLHKAGLMNQIFVGENDNLFTPEEFDQDLQIEKFVTRIKNVGHVSLSTEEGCDYIAEVIRLGLSDEKRELIAA